MFATPFKLWFVAVLVTSGAICAVEPPPPIPEESTLSAGQQKVYSLEEHIKEGLVTADKMAWRRTQRDVRPSDPAFDRVMRRLPTHSPISGDQLSKIVELLASKDSRVRYVALALIDHDWNTAGGGSTAILKDSTAFQLRLTELLQDELWETADAAALQLSLLNTSEWPCELTDYVVTQLRSEQPAIQVRAARLVRTAGKPPVAAEVLLLAALKSPVLDTERSEFAWALFHYGNIPAESVPTFKYAMQNWVTIWLGGGGMCCASSSVVEAKKKKVHKEFRAILPLLGPDAVPAIPVLIESLAAGSIETRRLAVVTLGQFGPLAESALPHLKSMDTKFVEESSSFLFGRTRYVTRIDREVATACKRIAGTSRK